MALDAEPDFWDRPLLPAPFHDRQCAFADDPQHACLEVDGHCADTIRLMALWAALEAGR